MRGKTNPSMLSFCSLGSVLDLKSGTWYVEKTPEGNIQRLSQDQRHAYGFTGWSVETIKNNLAPNWIDSNLQKNPDFFVTFGVFFTAVTGIVAGANLSGDLKVKNPTESNNSLKYWIA